MVQKLFSCKSLRYSIGYKKILKDISFSLQLASCVLVTGDNGSGKSTLLRVLSNYTKFSQFISWDVGLDAKRVKVSYAGHQLGLYSSLTLQENIDYFNGILSHPMQPEQIEIFLEVFQLKKRRYDPITTFSQGMKQKAALIRSFLPQPYVYLLDEPMVGLDKKSIEQFLYILTQLKQQSSLLVVSHNPQLLQSVTDAGLHIEAGCSRYV